MSYAPTDDYQTPRLTPAVLWLLAIPVALYFLQITVQESLPTWLGFNRSEVGTRPWGALTYMFVHAGFWHLALNMYMLFSFGPRLERAWTPGAFTRFYLWCGLGGVALHALFVTGASLLVGASAAIFGLVYAYARRWPDDEVLFFGVVPMKVKWLVAFMVVTNLVLGVLSAGSAGGGGTAYLAHLGGVAFAWLYFVRPQAPSVERLRQRVAPMPDIGDEPPRAVPKSFPRPRERGSEADEIVEKSKALTARPQPARPVAPPPPPPPVRPPRPVPAAASARDARAAALDLVLDKISEQGIASLTLDERRLLDEMSQKLRGS